MKGKLFHTFLVASLMLVLVVSAAGPAFIATRGDYDDPEIVDAYYIAPTSPNVIDELTTISPASISMIAGDINFAQLSIPNILDTTPNLKVYRFDLSSDRTSIFTRESLNISYVNELVEFVQATSVDHQNI